jgi:hypothetical protein
MSKKIVTAPEPQQNKIVENKDNNKLFININNNNNNVKDN